MVLFFSEGQSMLVIMVWCKFSLQRFLLQLVLFSFSFLFLLLVLFLQSLSLLSQPRLLQVPLLLLFLQLFLLRPLVSFARFLRLVLVLLCPYLGSCPVPPFRIGSHGSFGSCNNPCGNCFSLFALLCQSTFFGGWFCSCHFV